MAILTYNLGVVIYVLPVPIKSIKKWGVNMMYDAISAAILISSFSLMTNLTNYILNLLGASWSSFFTWISSRAALIFAIFSSLTYIGGLLRNPLLGILTSPINIVLGYLSAALSAIKALLFLGSFIQEYYRHIILLGILLYSLPFRIGKSAGAYLISFALVFFICMPLMPAFVETFQQVTPPVDKAESIEISGYVVDSLGNPVANIVLNLHDNNNVLMCSILTDHVGRYILGGGYDALPRNFNYTVSLELYGFTLYAIPEVISDSLCSTRPKCNLNISAPGLIIGPSSKIAILRTHTVNVVKADVNENAIKLTLHSFTDANDLLIVYPESTVIKSIFVNYNEITCSYNHGYEWYGIKVSMCRLEVNKGIIDITIDYEGVRPPKPSINEKRIVVLEDLTTIIINLLTLSMGFIFSLVFLPSLYLTLLLSISASLARLLGGRGLSIRVF